MKNKKRPNFIIAGFPKCGSTALHYYLDNHPEIFMPRQKELHFFTNHIIAKLNNGPGDKEAKINQISNLDSYEKCFENANELQIIGEASPSYINYPSVFKKIKDELNSPKLIIMLRDPIKRAYSNYLHLVREHRESLSFYNALVEEKERIKKGYSDFWYYQFNSSYYDKVFLAQKTFDKVLVLTQEELNRDTKGTIKKVFSFLEVDENYIPNNMHQRYNHGGVFKDNLITRFFFKQTKFKSTIKKFVPIPVQLKNILNKIVSKYRQPTPEIDIKAEDYLVGFFKEDVKKLKNIGVDVKFWNPKYFE
jgi:hypothetical protein